VVESAHVTGDTRFQLLDATLQRHQFRPDALIEVLHRAQDLFGYLRPDVLFHVARSLKLPPSRVYGVATFYHLFSLQPPGTHACVVCLGTACFIKGAELLLRTAERCAGIKAGETTKNGQLSLSSVRCIGTCGIAPLAIYDGTTAGQQTPDDVRRHVKGWLQHGS
jgi:bidirectional [NiFe] hydrogenase diaphorase subunit